MIIGVTNQHYWQAQFRRHRGDKRFNGLHNSPTPIGPTRPRHRLLRERLTATYECTMEGQNKADKTHRQLKLRKEILNPCIFG